MATDFSPEILDQLLSGGLKPEDLTGEDGLFKRLKKDLLERALGAELILRGCRRGRSRTRPCDPRSPACSPRTSRSMVFARSGANSGAKASMSPDARWNG